MPNSNTFDEATAATQEMFAAHSEDANDEQLALSDVPPAGNSPAQAERGAENPPVEEAPAENSQAGAEAPPTVPPETETPPSDIEQAAETAELAAQVATEKNDQLSQAMAEIEALKQQNQQLQGAIDEISNRNMQELTEEVLQPPVLDVNALAFADEETVAAAQAKFAADMAAYNRRQIMKELSPALEYAKEGMREKEKTEAISALSKIPELSGIDGMLPQLDRIIANNKWLQSDDMPMEEKYINAFAMAKGVNSINTPPPAPKEPTTEELMELYNANPEFQAMVEKQRLEKIKESQQVPPFSASSGAVNAALNIKEKPQTLEEASKRTREMFGSM